MTFEQRETQRKTRADLLRAKTAPAIKIWKSKLETLGVDTSSAMKSTWPLTQLKKLFEDFIEDGGNVETEQAVTSSTAAPAAAPTPTAPSLSPQAALSEWTRLSRMPNPRLAQDFLRANRPAILAGHIEASEGKTGSARARAAFEKRQLVKI